MLKEKYSVLGGQRCFNRVNTSEHPIRKETANMSFSIKRIYDPIDTNDGKRILVDRLWPRGVTKQKAQLDGWF